MMRQQLHIFLILIYLKNVYRRVTNVEHNFLLIDNDPKDENLKIRQNFNELIKIY